MHGPAVVGHDSFIGMQALVFNACVGGNCVIEPGAKVVGRGAMITIPDGRFVQVGQCVTSQGDADALPEVASGYPFAKTNRAVISVNVQLADGYNGSEPPPTSGVQRGLGGHEAPSNGHGGSGGSGHGH